MRKYLLVLLFALLVVLPGYAQDATAEPTEAATVEPTAQATQEATETGGDDSTATVQTNTTGTIFLILIPILSVALAGGGVMGMIVAFRKNQAAVNASEQLGSSVPQPIADRMLTVIDTLSAALSAGREAIDRIPAANKSDALGGITIDQLIIEMEKRGYTVKAPGAPAG